MTRRETLSSWRSAEAEQRFRALEDELAADLVPEPGASVDVPTRLGPTRAYRWDGTGEPVVFLHGTAGTWLSWAPYVERRAGRTAYAVDTIGDVGRSRQEVAVEGPGDLADWLAEVLSGLGVAGAHLVGTSYGGFLALNLAVHHPGLVRSLFLVEPASIAPVRMAMFMLWGTSALFASWLPTPLRLRAARRLRMPVLEDPRLLRFGLYGQLHHRARLLRPEPFTDDRLRRIDRPTCVVVGGRSEVFRPADVRARAESLLPDATVEVVADAGHGLALSHVDPIATRLTSFLSAADDRAGA